MARRASRLEEGADIRSVGRMLRGRPRSWRGCGRRKLSLQYLAQLGRVKPCIREYIPVTSAVRAEGGIAGPARVLHAVACRAGRIDRLIVQRDPVRITVGLGLRTAT